MCYEVTYINLRLYITIYFIRIEVLLIKEDSGNSHTHTYTQAHIIQNIIVLFFDATDSNNDMFHYSYTIVRERERGGGGVLLFLRI